MAPYTNQRTKDELVSTQCWKTLFEENKTEFLYNTS